MTRLEVYPSISSNRVLRRGTIPHVVTNTHNDEVLGVHFFSNAVESTLKESDKVLPTPFFPKWEKDETDETKSERAPTAYAYKSFGKGTYKLPYWCS